MNDLPHVSWPSDLSWVLRTGNQEPLFQQCPCRLAKKFFKFGLTIRGVRTHVTQIAGEGALWSRKLVVSRIKGAVRREGSLRAKFAFKLTKHGSPVEAEINVKPSHRFR